MSIVSQGILGGFSGKTGPVIGSSWKGKPVMRAKPIYKKNRTFSKQQVEQQEKFKMMMTFLHSIDYLLNLTYKTNNNTRSGFQEAFSVNLKDAVAGVESPFDIDYAKVRLSKGSIPTIAQCTLSAEASNMIAFSWNGAVPENNGNKSSTADRAIAVLYCPEDKSFLVSHFSTRRSDQELLLDAAAFTGKEVHGWFFFLSDDESRASDTKYLGAVLVRE
ncbi:MAG: hypothetical protein HYI21_09105 [Sediminibacterium sp. Gen4]|jgi:hypothetical protein|uniref:DUF6266 family protein n=1 Tax=unclassified Sediminibacterium TaxID=2635961 RepID=UPI0015BBA9CB|nr:MULTISPECIES: DUF6266 family protein [unclassified Sediminibacterium]MBW0161359.1 hypothetical protein [Sediminibacterium sp.]MBW0163274.1 hypothetical protein [Sediminibacterium sp.]NWK66171.1 hypothetical protein [Sediminibacterium sp. Gen4]